MRADTLRHRPEPAPAPVVRVLPRPPAPPDTGPGSGLFHVVLPALGGLGTVVFLLAGRHPLMLLAGVVMLVVTVGGAAGVAVSSRVGPRRRFLLARNAYLDALGEVRREVRETTLRLRRHDEEVHPEPSALFARILTGAVSPRPVGEASLVRVGSGTLPHPIRLAPPEVNADPVSARAMSTLVHAYRSLPRAPLLVDLACGEVAVLGDRADVHAVMRGMVLQVVAAHGPSELGLSIVTDRAVDFRWARWLPHLENADGSLRIGEDLPPLPPRTNTGSDGIRHLVVVDGRTRINERPGQCVIRLGHDDAAPTWIEVAGDRAELVVGAADHDLVSGEPDLVGAGLAESAARALAARRGSGRVCGAAGADDIGARVLGVGSVDEFDPTRSWSRTRDDEDFLTVLVGRDADGGDLRLDLKESGHGGVGPHGLLVGATGSGKSELLRSLVLGLAAGHHPDDLAFVLVDYKGGATFSGLEGLPHVAGVVTNLGEDLGLVDRMHTALLGEIARRQQVLHDAGRLSDIYAHRAARAHGGLEPLPHLLVVVDEFAELLTATPDLLDLFTTIGRIGRSIGVHQLLASQRLDDGRLRGLESFLSYRFALRTFTPEESRAVIGTPDAAELPALPGAGILRTARTTRFQAAYVSAPEERARPLGTPSVRQLIWPPAVEPEPAPRNEARPTVLDVAAARMQEAATATRRVWLPPLPTRLAFEDLADHPSPGKYVARIGLVDLPAEQRTAPLDLDLRRGDCHIAVLGGPDSGRSATLRTIVHALARRHGPRDLVVHGVDLDGDSLRPLAALPQVGSVAGRREEDLTRRILRQVVRTIDERADAGPAERPEMLLLIDGYTSLRADDDLHELAVAVATRGAELGVHLLLTASRWHDLRPALQSAVHSRVELRLADPMDSLIDRRLATTLTAGCPGRALTAGGHPAQILAPGGDLDEETAYLAIAAAHEDRAAPVRLLPRDLRLADLLDLTTGNEQGRCWLGLSETDLQPVSTDGDVGHLMVIGDRRSGRTSLLASVLRQRLADPACVVALVDPRRTLMDELPTGRLAGYATNVVAAEDIVRSLASELQNRATRLQQDDSPDGRPASRIVLAVDDAELVLGGHNPLLPLEPFLPLSEIGFDLIVVRHSGGAGRALYDPVLQRMKELGCTGVLLSGDPEEGPLWPGAYLRPLPPGRAILARRGHSPVLVHLARP